MMQARFATREQYMQFRAEWRKGYKSVAAAIRQHKKDIKEKGQEHDKEAQAHLEFLRMSARCMMISLDAVKTTFIIDKANRLSQQYEQVKIQLNTQHNKLEGRYMSKKARMRNLRDHPPAGFNKPSEAEIQARREAKHGTGMTQKAEQITGA